MPPSTVGDHTAAAVPVRSGTVQVAGRSVGYHDSVADPEGLAPVLLVHGTGGSTRRHFPFLFPMLAAHRRVVSVDLTTPDGPPEAGVERLAAQVLAVLDEVLPGHRVALTGYSLGAVVAATVAATRPAAVGTLVLLAGWLRTDTQQRLRNDVWHALRPTPELLGRYQAYCAYSAPWLAQRTPAELEALVAGVAADDATAAQMEINRVVDLREVAARIGCPTLVVAGTDDQMTPRRQAKQLFGAVTGARYTEVTTGHAMVTERPAELVHLVNTFADDPQRHPAGTVLPARRP